ncbi:hypothetical protein V7S43_017411 [Phytophthora oleae]|uniref:Uncharacterized protein n=1 Tax=Phytophthora oleae TaxID=2107226 RepID=A0ABD3EVA0_9STRA
MEVQQSIGRKWFEDRKWLEQDCRKISSDVSLFAEATKTEGLSPDAVSNRHQSLANEVISKFASWKLRTKFVTPSGKGLIGFENVVGGLCRGWLNDSHVDFCLEILASSATLLLAVFADMVVGVAKYT